MIWQKKMRGGRLSVRTQSSRESTNDSCWRVEWFHSMVGITSVHGDKLSFGSTWFVAMKPTCRGETTTNRCFYHRNKSQVYEITDCTDWLFDRAIIWALRTQEELRTHWTIAISRSAGKCVYWQLDVEESRVKQKREREQKKIGRKKR